MTVPHASLKVYEPLEAFPAEERERLRALASVPSVPMPTLVLSRAHGLADGGAADRVEAVVVDGELRLCPHRARLRLLAALVAFRRSIPAEVAGAFMPDGEAERALSELEDLRASNPGWRSHILTSTWEVPVRWFVAFDDSEREADPAGPTLRYRTTMLAARGRTERALEAARRAVVGPGVVALVSDLARWLELFDPNSVVELDYGALARLMAPRTLLRDRSARDIQNAVSALDQGDVLRATAFYMRAAERWAPLAALERTN